MTSGVPRWRYPGRRLLRLLRISQNPLSAVSLLAGRDPEWQSDFRIGRLVLTARRTDIGAIADVAIEDDYHFIRGLPFPGAHALILDIGANIGCFAALVFSICPAAEVHSVEPSPDTFALLASNRDRYRALRWHVHQSAIAATGGTLCFRNDGLSPSRKLSTGWDGIPVTAEAFDVFVSRVAQGRRVFLCKMDIEGTEVAIFSGTMNILADIDHFVVEVHGPSANTDLVNARLSNAFHNVQLVPGRVSTKPLIHAWRDRPAQGQNPRKAERPPNRISLTA